ncbi:hypothetical protein EV644_12137 [Kribbella orskensis]|uniref:Uncharacterized protein n=1 Tax=Kribbella orskensis TaxID=2512216 RepID=A0ABY2BCS2_9ACTN|nr:hypothetical protein [Kribbella sp. VKM Ac-2500]TCN33636.1 hypothetical protein EV642_12395 [Kribbella sp. VKM Ac-2500]TCO13957.1 hypothetical protein EV644_12137 [Kribbella orskensis]
MDEVSATQGPSDVYSDDASGAERQLGGKVAGMGEAGAKVWAAEWQRHGRVVFPLRRKRIALTLALIWRSW